MNDYVQLLNDPRWIIKRDRILNEIEYRDFLKKKLKEKKTYSKIYYKETPEKD